MKLLFCTISKFLICAFIFSAQEISVILSFKCQHAFFYQARGKCFAAQKVSFMSNDKEPVQTSIKVPTKPIRQVEVASRPWTSALYVESLREEVKRQRKMLRGDVRNNLDLLRTLLHYVWPLKSGFKAFRTKVFLLLSVVCLFLGKLVGVKGPFLLQKAVDQMVQTKPAQGQAVVPFLLFGMYGLAKTIAVFLAECKTILFTFVSQNASRDYAQRIFNHLHMLDSTFHHNNPTGLLSVAYVRGIRGFQAILFQLVFTVVPTVLEVTMVSSVLARRFGAGYLIATVVMFLSYCGFTVAITEYRVDLRRDLVTVDNSRTAFFVDSFANHEVVKLFSNEHRELAQFDQYLQRILKTSLVNTWVVSSLNLGQTLIFQLGLFTIMVLSATKVAAGAMTVGQLVAVNGLLLQLAVPFHFIGTTYQELRQGFVDMEVLNNFLDRIPTVKDSGKMKLPSPRQVYNELMQPLFGEIEFQDVSFKYPNTTDYILKNISCKIPPSKNFAIVGPSGCGKSTMLKLLVRLFDVDHGRILIDGKDIRDITLASLRGYIGVVPQETTLFDATIEQNIMYGKPNATADEVKCAAKKARIHDRIMTQPEGYKTRVGERGAKISGGERQRMALARALIRDPLIMIYDEVTSAVDSLMETQIIESLREVATNRTTLMVAHRLANVVDADCIIVLSDGHILEKGTHDELMTNASSLYARMWEVQRSTGYSTTGRGMRIAPTQINFIRAIEHPTLQLEAGFLSPEEYVEEQTTHSEFTSVKDFYG